MDSFIIGGNAISSNSYSSDYGIPKDFVDKNVDPVHVECTDQLSDEMSIKKILRYKWWVKAVAIAAGVCFASFFIAMIIVGKKHHQSESDLLFVLGFFIGLIFVGLACFINYRMKCFFKGGIVDKALQNHYQACQYNRTSQFLSLGLLDSFRHDEISYELIQETKLSHLVKVLNLGGKEWSSGCVSDEILGLDGQISFRFFDTFLEYVYSKGSGKNSRTVHIPVFRGQIYIFPAKVNYSCDRLYLPCSVERTGDRLSDFFIIFESFPYQSEKDPFIRKSGRNSGGDFISKFLGGEQDDQFVSDSGYAPHDPRIETPEFMECLLRLHMIFRHKSWGVRVINGFFVLIIMRDQDVLELAFSEDLTSSFEKLHRELAEMYSITRIISNYSKASNKWI